MSEVDALLQAVLQTPSAERLSYAEVFRRYLGIAPHAATVDTLRVCAADHQLAAPHQCKKIASVDYIVVDTCDRTSPGRRRTPAFVYDFPEELAMLARVRPGTPPLAERFELYVGV